MYNEKPVYIVLEAIEVSGPGQYVWLLPVENYLKGYTQLPFLDRIIRISSLFEQKCSRYK